MEEQLLQEARKEAEKVYPFKKGNDFSKGFNSEIVKINLDLLHKQELFIEGYIAKAKKQMSEAVDFNRFTLSIEGTDLMNEGKSLEMIFNIFKQQKQ